MEGSSTEVTLSWIEGYASIWRSQGCGINWYKWTRSSLGMLVNQIEEWVMGLFRMQWFNVRDVWKCWSFCYGKKNGRNTIEMFKKGINPRVMQCPASRGFRLSQLLHICATPDPAAEVPTKIHTRPTQALNATHKDTYHNIHPPTRPVPELKVSYGCSRPSSSS